MTRFPFTPQGVADLQEALYQTDDAGLMEEVMSVAEDVVYWAARHFELEVFLLEGIRSLPAKILHQLGWSIAICLIGRKTFVMDDLAVPKRALHDENSNLSFQLYFSASFLCKAGPDSTPRNITIHSDL